MSEKPILPATLDALVVALLCGAVALLARWCVVPARADPRPEADASVEAPALAARMRVWQPLWRPLRAGELEGVAASVARACRADPWPSPERCPDLLAALAFKESSWRADVVGRRGEVGLVQIMPGPAMAGETRERAADPDRNLALGLAWLRRLAFSCRLAGRGSDEAALSAYAGLRCGPSRGAALALRWARELRDVRP